MTKDEFFREQWLAGETSLKACEKKWKESPYYQRKQHSCKQALEEAVLSGKILTRAELEAFLQEQGTENDKKFAAEYWRQVELALKCAELGMSALKEMRA